MKTKFLPLAILFLIFSCTQEQKIKPQNSVQVLKASTALTNNFVAFAEEIKSTSFPGSRDSKFDIGNFEPSKLSELKLTLKGESSSQFAVQSSDDPGLTMIVDFASSGKVSAVAFSETTKIVNGYDVKIYDLDGFLRTNYVTDGKTLTIIKADYVSNGRTSGWFQRTGDCVAQAAQPFRNGLLNLAFDVAASYVTFGWYPVVLTAACGIRSI